MNTRQNKVNGTSPPELDSDDSWDAVSKQLKNLVEHDCRLTQKKTFVDEIKIKPVKLRPSVVQRAFTKSKNVVSSTPMIHKGTNNFFSDSSSTISPIKNQGSAEKVPENDFPRRREENSKKESFIIVSSDSPSSFPDNKETLKASFRNNNQRQGNSRTERNKTNIGIADENTSNTNKSNKSVQNNKTNIILNDIEENVHNTRSYAKNKLRGTTSIDYRRKALTKNKSRSRSLENTASTSRSSSKTQDVNITPSTPRKSLRHQNPESLKHTVDDTNNKVRNKSTSSNRTLVNNISPSRMAGEISKTHSSPSKSLVNISPSRVSSDTRHQNKDKSPNGSFVKNTSHCTSGDLKNKTRTVHLDSSKIVSSVIQENDNKTPGNITEKDTSKLTNKSYQSSNDQLVVKSAINGLKTSISDQNVPLRRINCEGKEMSPERVLLLNILESGDEEIAPQCKSKVSIREMTSRRPSTQTPSKVVDENVLHVKALISQTRSNKKSEIPIFSSRLKFTERVKNQNSLSDKNELKEKLDCSNLQRTTSPKSINAIRELSNAKECEETQSKHDSRNEIVANKVPIVTEQNLAGTNNSLHNNLFGSEASGSNKENLERNKRPIPKPRTTQTKQITEHITPNEGFQFISNNLKIGRSKSSVLKMNDGVDVGTSMTFSSTSSNSAEKHRRLSNFIDRIAKKALKSTATSPNHTEISYNTPLRKTTDRLAQTSTKQSNARTSLFKTNKLIQTSRRSEPLNKHLSSTRTTPNVIARHTQTSYKNTCSKTSSNSSSSCFSNLSRLIDDCEKNSGHLYESLPPGSIGERFSSSLYDYNVLERTRMPWRLEDDPRLTTRSSIKFSFLPSSSQINDRKESSAYNKVSLKKLRQYTKKSKSLSKQKTRLSSSSVSSSSTDELLDNADISEAVDSHESLILQSPAAVSPTRTGVDLVHSPHISQYVVDESAAENQDCSESFETNSNSVHKHQSRTLKGTIEALSEDENEKANDSETDEITNQETNRPINEQLTNVNNELIESTHHSNKNENLSFNNRRSKSAFQNPEIPVIFKTSSDSGHKNKQYKTSKDTVENANNDLIEPIRSTRSVVTASVGSNKNENSSFRNILSKSILQSPENLLSFKTHRDSLRKNKQCQRLRNTLEDANKELVEPMGPADSGSRKNENLSFKGILSKPVTQSLENLGGFKINSDSLHKNKQSIPAEDLSEDESENRSETETDGIIFREPNPRVSEWLTNVSNELIEPIISTNFGLTPAGSSNKNDNSSFKIGRSKNASEENIKDLCGPENTENVDSHKKSENDQPKHLTVLLNNVDVNDIIASNVANNTRERRSRKQEPDETTSGPYRRIDYKKFQDLATRLDFEDTPIKKKKKQAEDEQISISNEDVFKVPPKKVTRPKKTKHKTTSSIAPTEETSTPAEACSGIRRSTRERRPPRRRYCPIVVIQNATSYDTRFFAGYTYQSEIENGTPLIKDSISKSKLATKQMRKNNRVSDHDDNEENINSKIEENKRTNKKQKENTNSKKLSVANTRRNEKNEELPERTPISESAPEFSDENENANTRKLNNKRKTDKNNSTAKEKNVGSKKHAILDEESDPLDKKQDNLTSTRKVGRPRKNNSKVDKESEHGVTDCRPVVAGENLDSLTVRRIGRPRKNQRLNEQSDISVNGGHSIGMGDNMDNFSNDVNETGHNRCKSMTEMRESNNCELDENVNVPGNSEVTHGVEYDNLTSNDNVLKPDSNKRLSSTDSGMSSLFKSPFHENNPRPLRITRGMSTVSKRKTDSEKIGNRLTGVLGGDGAESVGPKGKLRKTSVDATFDKYVDISSEYGPSKLKFIQEDPTFSTKFDRLKYSDSLDHSNGGSMVYLEIPPGERKQKHTSRKYNLFFFISEGRGRVFIGDKVSTFKKTSRFVIPTGLPYSITNDSPTEALLLACVRVPTT